MKQLKGEFSVTMTHTLFPSQLPSQQTTTVQHPLEEDDSCLSWAHGSKHIVQRSTKHIITTTHSSHLHYYLIATMTHFSHHNYRVNKLPRLTVRLLLLFYGGVVTTITAARHGWAISIGSMINNYDTRKEGACHCHVLFFFCGEMEGL